jgi:hypothetical protein
VARDVGDSNDALDASRTATVSGRMMVVAKTRRWMLTSVAGAALLSTAVSRADAADQRQIERGKYLVTLGGAGRHFEIHKPSRGIV